MTVITSILWTEGAAVPIFDNFVPLCIIQIHHLQDLFWLCTIESYSQSARLRRSTHSFGMRTGASRIHLSSTTPRKFADLTIVWGSVERKDQPLQSKPTHPSIFIWHTVMFSGRGRTLLVLQTHMSIRLLTLMNQNRSLTRLAVNSGRLLLAGESERRGTTGMAEVLQ